MPKTAPCRANKVNIIAGKWKRTPLCIADKGVRPTPGRARTALFGWLAHLLGHQWKDIQVLDLFAGSGALGLEAASRGAQKVVLVERLRPLIEALKYNQQHLNANNVEIITANALAYIKGDITYFDIILLDPPFTQNLYPSLLPQISVQIKSGALLYCEYGDYLNFGAFPQLKLLRHAKVGGVFFYLLKKL